ncbi:hypothetical protein E2I00_013589, partial [Balaenoptera physalus]
RTARRRPGLPFPFAPACRPHPGSSLQERLPLKPSNPVALLAAVRFLNIAWGPLPLTEEQAGPARLLAFLQGWPPTHGGPQPCLFTAPPLPGWPLRHPTGKVFVTFRALAPQSPWVLLAQDVLLEASCPRVLVPLTLAGVQTRTVTVRSAWGASPAERSSSAPHAPSEGPFCALHAQSQAHPAGESGAQGRGARRTLTLFFPSLPAGVYKGRCFRINHFPEDNDYDHDSSEYLLRLVRASSVFPILSTVLLLLGGLCIGAGRLHSRKNNIVLSAGILFVAAGEPSALVPAAQTARLRRAAGMTGGRSQRRRGQIAQGVDLNPAVPMHTPITPAPEETVGVLAVNIYIEKNKELRFKTKREFLKAPSSSPYARMPSYRYRRRHSRSSSRSTEASPSRDASPVGLKIAGAIPMGELAMYTLSREPLKVTTAASYSPDQEAGFLQVHDFFQQDLKGDVHISMLNRRTTPV